MKNSWQNIARLLMWFYLKVEDTTCGNEIKIRDKIKKDKKSLKIQCYWK